MNQSISDSYLTKVQNGHLLNDSEKYEVSNFCQEIIRKGCYNLDEYQCIYNILSAANIYYNNDFNGILLIDDFVYDALIIMLKNNNNLYPIGAPRVILKDKPDNLLDNEQPKKQIVSFIPNMEEMHYFGNLTRNMTPSLHEDYVIHHDSTIVDKKTRNVSHNYDMCGTLDKCKYVLDNDARAEGMFDNGTVTIFERDFLAKHIAQGIVNPADITLLVSLKYDGISVENTIKGYTIVSSCSRGDVYNNEASDLTPILGGMEFTRAKNANLNEDEFGIKFEYVITTSNLIRLTQDTKVNYVNKRNAVIGLFGRLDARKFRDYLTPVPLESTLNTDRLTEVEFLNKYYTKGLDLRYIVIRGNYLTVLAQLKKFVEEASNIRTFMNFAYDGVVVEYVDPQIRNILGKLNSVPRYAIAIKFNPLKRQSIFTHYTYSIGQSGVIIPMAHFNPVEFFGAIHDKTTIHSIARFRKLNLRAGDRVNLTLNNDVIVYLTKAVYDDEIDNVENPKEPEEFPIYCPCCGTKLILSDSGDSAYCPNYNCSERCIQRISNMLKKLNIKDFSIATIRVLGIKSCKELFNVVDTDQERICKILGNVNGPKFIQRIKELQNAGYPDYRLLGSIGFTGIAIATWNLLLKYITVEELFTVTDEELTRLTSIKGIGMKTINTIILERKVLYDDIYALFTKCKYSKTEKGSFSQKPIVTFSGVRDVQLAKLYEDKGFQVKESGVTNDTSILIVPFYGFQSGKVTKAFKIKETRARQQHGIKVPVSYDTIVQYPELVHVYPYVMDINAAYEFIKNYQG